MLDGQGLAVHANRENGLPDWVGERRQRRTGSPAVVTLRQHHVGARQRLRLGQKLAYRVSQPERVAGQVTANFVGDAGPRWSCAPRAASRSARRVDLDGVLDHSGDPERPRFGIDHGHLECGVDSIEVVIRSDIGSQALDVEVDT